MDLYQLLIEEHSKRQCDRIVRYIGKDKDRFAVLMDLFFQGEYRITQRAAWPMSYCVRAHPELIRPYFKPLLDNLPELKLIIEEQWPRSTPAFRSRAKKIRTLT